VTVGKPSHDTYNWETTKIMQNEHLLIKIYEESVQAGNSVEVIACCHNLDEFIWNPNHQQVGQPHILYGIKADEKLQVLLVNVCHYGSSRFQFSLVNEFNWACNSNYLVLRPLSTFVLMVCSKWVEDNNCIVWVTGRAKGEIEWSQILAEGFHMNSSKLWQQAITSTELPACTLSSYIFIRRC
jgi:hypothetical protein